MPLSWNEIKTRAIAFMLHICVEIGKGFSIHNLLFLEINHENS